MQEKYGFIYIWFDKKHRKYYLGRHWGFANDGYICSSTGMRNNYKNRPYDFKRIIVSYVYTTKEDLVLEEQRWLDFIDPSKLNKYGYEKDGFVVSDEEEDPDEESADDDDDDDDDDLEYDSELSEEEYFE